MATICKMAWTSWISPNRPGAPSQGKEIIGGEIKSSIERIGGNGPCVQWEGVSKKVKPIG